MTVNISEYCYIVAANDLNVGYKVPRAHYIGQITNNNRVTPIFLFWVNT
jgi:hypothetical protein